MTGKTHEKSEVLARFGSFEMSRAEYRSRNGKHAGHKYRLSVREGHCTKIFAEIFSETPSQGLHKYYRSASGPRAMLGFMSILAHDKTFSRPGELDYHTFHGCISCRRSRSTLLFYLERRWPWRLFFGGSPEVSASAWATTVLLTHRGYKTPKWMEYFLTVCGTLALEGGPIAWVATHRVHHQKTDKEGDPHSPRDGGLWAHMGWILTGQAMHNSVNGSLALCSRSAKGQVSCLDHQVALGTAHGAGNRDSSRSAAGLVYCGGSSLRTVFGLHSTWLVNSATHMWGSRRFLTDDTSKNSLWVALLTFGEGWHNNHHAVPQSARHGLAWYEIDLNWYGICALRALGLAWDIKRHKLARLGQAGVTTRRPISAEGCPGSLLRCR